jgi:hypothetical protein
MGCGNPAGASPRDSGNSETPERIATDRRSEPSRVLESGPTIARGTFEPETKIITLVSAGGPASSDLFGNVMSDVTRRRKINLSTAFRCARSGIYSATRGF